MTGQQWRLNNLYLLLLLFFLRACFICATGGHQLCFVYGCFDSSDTHIYLILDGDEICYADFKNNASVWEHRIPIAIQSVEAYECAESFRIVCKKDIGRWKPDPDVRRTLDPPEVIIYSRSEAVRDEENTLVCFVNNFFPPAINIRWTKNDEEVKTENPFIKTICNADGTFHVFSYLNFVPKQGDIYSCTVEHEALENPKTRIWDVETDDMRIGPPVFCALGVTVGFLGVAAGTFLLVKGSQYCDNPDVAG